MRLAQATDDIDAADPRAEQAPVHLLCRPDRWRDRREHRRNPRAQVFQAVLGALNYTYIKATWSHHLPDWIGSHMRTLSFFSGCTELWVPDNLRSGISKASRYEPDVNRTYHDLAKHYGLAVLPARPPFQEQAKGRERCVGSNPGPTKTWPSCPTENFLILY